MLLFTSQRRMRDHPLSSRYAYRYTLEQSHDHMYEEVDYGSNFEIRFIYRR